MYSLSYYYTGPMTKSKATVTIGGKTRHLTGTIWFEHQRGTSAPVGAVDDSRTPGGR